MCGVWFYPQPDYFSGVTHRNTLSMELNYQNKPETRQVKVPLLGPTYNDTNDDMPDGSSVAYLRRHMGGWAWITHLFELSRL